VLPLCKEWAVGTAARVLCLDTGWHEWAASRSGRFTVEKTAAGVH